MTVTVDVMEKSYERVLSYGKEEIDGKLRRENDRSARTEIVGPYLVCDGITITIDDMARALDATVRRSSATSFASELVEILSRALYMYLWDFCRR